MSTKVSTEELFNAAVQVIRGLPKNGSYSPSHQLMLRFYGFYKQATEGPCEQPKPAFWDVIGKAKWDAWKKLGDMPKEEAMLSYVDELKKTASDCAPGLTTAEKARIAKIVETMAYTDQVEKFMDILDPFFDLVDFLERPDNFRKLQKDGEDLNGDIDVPLHDAANLTNGTGYNHNDLIEVNNSVNVKGKETLSEKYYSDSDSENDEFSDPIEMQAEEMKVLKKYRIDHNDNDSGFADQADNGVNGQNDQRWITSNGSIGNGVLNGHAEEHAYLVNERDVNTMNLKGVVARGGGDQDETASSASSIMRRGSPPHDGRGRGQRDPSNQQDLTPSGRRHPVAGLGSSGRTPGNGLFQQQPADINEQIAMALLRLQRDMDSVLARLNVLETVALAQHNTAQDRLAVHYNAASQLQPAASSPSWWPFKDVRFRTFLFFLAWPFIVQIIIKIMARRRARIIQMLLPLIIFLNDRRLALLRKR